MQIHCRIYSAENSRVSKVFLPAQSNPKNPVISSIKLDFILAVTLIIKTIIGAGILGLPYAVRQCGLLFAIMVSIFAITSIQFSSSLLLKAKNLSGHSNYSTILYHIFNHKFSKAFGSLLIFLSTIGTCNK